MAKKYMKRCAISPIIRNASQNYEVAFPTETFKESGYTFSFLSQHSLWGSKTEIASSPWRAQISHLLGAKWGRVLKRTVNRKGDDVLPAPNSLTLDWLASLQSCLLAWHEKRGWPGLRIWGIGWGCVAGRGEPAALTWDWDPEETWLGGRVQLLVELRQVSFCRWIEWRLMFDSFRASFFIPFLSFQSFTECLTECSVI